MLAAANLPEKYFNFDAVDLEPMDCREDDDEDELFKFSEKIKIWNRELTKEENDSLIYLDRDPKKEC